MLDPKKAKLSRDQLVFKLRMDFGIKCGTHYMPLVQTMAFKNKGFKDSDAPVSVKLWKNLLTLPINPRMKNEHAEYMLNAIKTLLK
jgi:dTDP-4-amino-4,6-dideoxygalactose transaminase